MVADLNWAGGQVVALGATSAQSPALQARLAAVSASQNCWISAGANPTAAKAAGSFYLGTGQIMYVPLQPGWKIAALQDSAAGTLSIIPCSYPN
jgi:hypothetical protein